ncbi:DUF481 domain-containing protein [Vibrio hibernica]|uniref:DUF481 domain-containing protein n=1 Tax=Vibrio hibernica TaxID=2587465 RepID=UPI0039AEAA33
MQKRILPLLFLLCSANSYSEESATISTDDSQPQTLPLSGAPQSADIAASETPELKESNAEQTKEDTQSKPDQPQEITFEEPESAEAPETTEQDKTQPNKDDTKDPKTAEEQKAKEEIEKSEEADSEVDDAAISKLLNENSDGSVQEEEPSPWESEVEFGYRSEQGNEDKKSLNARVSISYIKGRLRNTGEVKVYMKDKDGEEDERDQTYQLQSDYKLSPKTYLYGNFKGITSKYKSYYQDYTVSTGFGYQITNTDTLKIEAELGPGYRYQEPNTDEIDDDDPIFPDNVQEPIIRANLTALWKPFERIGFNFDGTVVTGSSNTRFDTEISIINNITESIALKIAQSRQHLSHVPNNLEKTNSTITINLLFSFK